TAPPANVELDCALKDKRATIDRLSVTALFAPSTAENEQRSSAPPLEFTGDFPLDLRGKELLPDGPIRFKGGFEMRDLSRVARALGSNPREVSGRLRADLDVDGTW